VSDVVVTPKVLDLFGSTSSTSENEAVAPTPVPHRKCPRKSTPKIT
jgi:hypothetical protein